MKESLLAVRSIAEILPFIHYEICNKLFEEIVSNDRRAVFNAQRMRQTHPRAWRIDAARSLG